MRTLLFAACLLAFVSCSKDEKNPCSLEKITDKTYFGKIHHCFGQSGQGVMEVDGKATITLLDSILSIHILSMDSIFPFDQVIMATSDCQNLDDTSWNFSSVPTHQDVGSAYGNGDFLLMEFNTGACTDDQFFLGMIQN